MTTAVSAWNSLEVAKLLVGFLTPVLLFVLGLIVARAARRVEDAQWASRKLVERRIELHQMLAPQLNDLMCFVRCVGHFREISPPDAIRTKREADKTFFVNEHLFSSAFGQLYRAFIDSCFVHWEFEGEDAKLRVSASWIKQERGERIPWEREWNSLFRDDSWNPAEQMRAYRELMEVFAVELGVQSRTNHR
jgi:hypothetical protein